MRRSESRVSAQQRSHYVGALIHDEVFLLEDSCLHSGLSVD